MIDPHWRVVDLDPRTWRAIGGFFNPAQYIRAAQPGEHGLFVLHDGGLVTRVVDTIRGLSLDLALANVDDPHKLAATLFARGEWQRVHVIDKRHLAYVAAKVQEDPHRDLTLDQYYRLVYNLVWDTSGGYVSVPAHPGKWRGWTYEDVQGFVAMLPDPATVALVVVDGTETSVGLVLDLHEGRIRTVTTLETFGLPAPTFSVAERDFERLWAMLLGRGADPQPAKERGRGGAPQPAAALLCSRRIYEQLIEEPGKLDKWALLHRAKEQGEAFWRMRLRD